MSTSVHRLLRFGMYEMNLDTQEISNAGTLVKLPPQPFKLLEMLASNSGQIVSREDIQKQLWGEDTFVDFERGVHKCINQIRNVLNDSVERPLYVETVPRRGYRFLAPVTSKNIAVVPRVMDSTPVDSETAAVYEKPISGIHDTAASGPAAVSSSSSVPASSAAVASVPSAAVAKSAMVADAKAPKPSTRTTRRQLVAWLGIAILAVAGGIVYWRSQRADALMEKDTLVLADFANSTTETVFDDTLKQALRIQLEQSPFLNLVSDQKVNATLKLAGRSTGDRLTPEVARDICQRVGSKAMITGTIAPLGSQYVIGLQAMNCNSGDVLAEALEQARNKEDVLKGLDRAALKVRRSLGESLRTVETFATPVEEATTPSLEALKAFTLAGKASREQGFAAGLPYSQRAIELDPKFAAAYYQLGALYLNLSEPGRAREYLTKAFELRDRASEHEKLVISATYYMAVTGELDKAAQTYQQLVSDYPRRYIAYQNLSVLYGQLGEYDKAIEWARKALVPPERVGEYDNLANFLLASQQLEEAGRIVQQTQARKLDSYYTYLQTYALAFLAADSSSMEKQLRWFASKSSFENFGLSLASDTEAYMGHSQKARQLTADAVASATRADNTESGAIWLENQALREAVFGHSSAAQQAADAGLKLDPKTLSVQLEAALAYAATGNTAKAEAMAREFNANQPLDTQVQSLWLPAIHAQIALSRKDPAGAISQLQRASPPIEYGTSPSILQVTCLYPTYIRAQAYLDSGQATPAAAEFKKILDHSGMVWNCWTGALARLGVARANAIQARNSQGAEADAAHSRALAAYQEFLSLWKDADANIPIYQQAKTEYQTLRAKGNQ